VISIECSIQLINGSEDRIAWVVAVIRDVTERYGREKELRAQPRVLAAKAVVR
jgi:hypothetical protein